MNGTAGTAVSRRTLAEKAPATRHAPPVRRRANSFYSGGPKRWFDIAFSLCALPLVIPLCLVLALLIKLDSPGPVLVKLKRLGKSGRIFHQYKFRTMVQDAEEVLERLLAADPMLRKEFETSQKLKHDPRITRIGTWLRKISLDELPQVLNVFRGEMSWVGPRAVRPDEIRMYGTLSQRLLTVLPGITGLWQVSGRSNLPYAQRIRLDMQYIDRMTFLTDLRIVLRTVPAMVNRNGAY